MVAEIYAIAVSNFADNTLTGTRIGSNAILAKMDTFTTFIQREKEDAKEVSRIRANIARTYAQASNDTGRVGSFSYTFSSSTITV